MSSEIQYFLFCDGPDCDYDGVGACYSREDSHVPIRLQRSQAIKRDGWKCIRTIDGMKDFCPDCYAQYKQDKDQRHG